ncbi:TPM domain-containing protein [Thiovibrio frasassiensis]|uniref:TPM domain-containing protein n=1 Tax=Thiovibrio frasassiensis TaxID=2984131 RepID=A0A9X4RMB7_9BACT|nr:TPM domain-containing protein [Thiovibrio frasassiensis]MDG4476210.1 TPM domain-containing protein [Thiovibrio frasassiensis]
MSQGEQHTPSRTGKPFYLFCLLTLCLLLVAGPKSAKALEVPQYQGYVTDLAGMISPGERQKLEQMLLAFEQSDSTQIAVLTIPSLEGDSLEDFSIRTVDAWKIGQKGKDNGVLLLVSKGDRKIRIEVGRGLEGVLTDLLAGRIVDQIISPRFKSGQLDQGFEAGITTIISATRGEYKGTGSSRRGARKGSQSSLFNYLIFFAILVGFLGRLSKPVGALAGAALLPLFAFLGISSPLGWLILLLLIPGGALLGLLLPLFFANAGGGGMYLGGGGFGGGGGGDSFGGFGGGGFGGGGASGGW